jgi:hypothetical protein
LTTISLPGGPAVDDPVEQAAVFACSYVVAFEDDRGRAQFSVKPFFESDDYSWPLLPREVDPEIAVWWPVLADLVQSPAPKARLHSIAFLRGGSDRARHAKAAGEAYLYAAHTAARKPESVDDLHAALRLSRAVRDVELAGRALNGLLDFVDSELQTRETGLGFAVQALEIAAAEPAPTQRVGGLAERISHAAQYVPLADRALKILLRRASEQDKPTIWRRRVELRRAEALASDHPAVKSARLQNVLQIAQESGQTDLRDLVAAALQACAKEDLGRFSFKASSHQYEEAVADQIEAMIGADTW